ncbi:YdcF family protein [Pantanalinema sp. GBBB05]|uniref:YdcF family protein n=1 Tax=Pantanalinema sp. GBBB05 TaxID=2604139 RepID=UPI001D5C21AF|nr:YdcF family protein [Pantanalinema sp. GBBB05]
MLEQTLCATRPATEQWIKFATWLIDSLFNPVIVILAVLLLFGVLWLLIPHYRRWLTRIAAGLVIGYLLLLSPPAVAISNRLLLGFVPGDSGQPADAIVVLGRGVGLRQSRADVAAQLWHTNRAPLVFISGRYDAPPIAEMVAQQGVPTTAISGESCSATTEENARFTTELLKPRQVNRIVLVTDSPHLLRSMLTCRSLGFEVIPHASPLPQLEPTQKAFLVFREYFGIVAYGLRGRFLARDLPPSGAVSALPLEG